MEQLDDFMAGEAGFLGFSTGTMTVMVAVIALSVASGVLARRFVFPRLMDILSKTERIDGKSVLAPASLGLSLIHI